MCPCISANNDNNGEVSICVTIAHTSAFRHQCKPQKQFSDFGS